MSIILQIKKKHYLHELVYQYMTKESIFMQQNTMRTTSNVHL